ncbi:MAG: VOC family protein [Terriglobales bacterium]
MPATTAYLGISGAKQVAINVHDLGRATAFYRDVLGLPFLFTTGALSFFNCAGLRVMLSPREASKIKLLCYRGKE